LALFIAELIAVVLSPLAPWAPKSRTFHRKFSVTHFAEPAVGSLHWKNFPVVVFSQMSPLL